MYTRHWSSIGRYCPNGLKEVTKFKQGRIVHNLQVPWGATATSTWKSLHDCFGAAKLLANESLS